MLKAAIRTDKGSQIGMGHYTRMSALADAFRELNSECALFFGEDEPVCYDGFDIVVTDTYLLSDEYISKLNKPGRIVVCYDDNGLYEYDCDVVLNANFHANEINFRFGAKRPRLLLGGRYALLRREFRETPPVVVREKATRAFVCFGGSDLRNFTPVVLKSLRDIADIDITVVLGEDTSCDDAVKAAAAVATVLKNPPNMAEVMSECDMAISAAGSMVYELAALGLPTLTVKQADNQNLIAEYLNRHSLMRCVGDWADFNEGIFRNEVAELLSDAGRRRRESALLKASVDKGGAMNAAREIIKLCRQTESIL